LHVDEVERFISGVLRSRERTLPVVVVSTASGATEPEIDAGALANELSGLAHVISLGGYLAWERFRDLTGAFDFVPPGGARIYWPGFGHERDRLRHPYWTRRRLAEGRPPFQLQAFRQLSRLSVGRVPRDPLVRDLQRAVREYRLAEAKATQGDRDLLEAYEEMLAEREQEVDGLDAQVEALTEDNQRLREDLDRQAKQWALVREAAEDEPEPPPEPTVDTWDEFAELAPALETTHFVLTDNARGHCGENPYPTPGRMWDHLEALAQAAEAYGELEAPVGGRLKEWIAENFQIEIALFDNDLRPKEFEFEGVTYSREPHVKVDDYKNPAECGRIYFAIDNEHARLIVDHVGLHQ
jgi:hypothetical protein